MTRLRVSPLLSKEFPVQWGDRREYKTGSLCEGDRAELAVLVRVGALLCGRLWCCPSWMTAEGLGKSCRGAYRRGLGSPLGL